MKKVRVNSTENQVINLPEARYKCHFPACGGPCCKNGRPGLYPNEIAIIRKNVKKFLPLMREEAGRKCEKTGFFTRRKKLGLPTMAISKGWCLFANEGCVLQKVGMAEGDKWKYKPRYCVLFPITHERPGDNEWYVRQKGFKGEEWRLFCLERTPAEKAPAAKSLKDELAYLDRLKGL